MNFLKQYTSIFNEKRASDIYTGGVHETPYEQVMKYVKVPNTFISFRSIDKIGINPQSKYETPNGIYCYPLKKISKIFDKKRKEIIVPFAGENPYCYILQLNKRVKGIKLSTYTERQLEKDIEKLQIEYRSLTDELIESSIKKSKFKTPGGLIWSITYFLAKELNPNKFPNTWNLIFSKNLKYQYVWDDKGESIIHHNEPLQCVFFNTRAFKVLEDVIMKRKEVLSKKKDRTSKVGNRYAELPDWLTEDKYGKNTDTTIQYNSDNNDEIVIRNINWKNGNFGSEDCHGYLYDSMWQNGKVLFGDIIRCNWIDGIFAPKDKSCKIIDSFWLNGIFKNGMFQGGRWLGGVFEGGSFKGGNWASTQFKAVWKNGNWIDGKINSTKFNKFIFSKVDPNKFYEFEEESETIEELENKVMN